MRRVHTTKTDETALTGQTLSSSEFVIDSTDSHSPLPILYSYRPDPKMIQLGIVCHFQVAHYNLPKNGGISGVASFPLEIPPHFYVKKWVKQKLRNRNCHDVWNPAQMTF